jgi:hypothetical protein
MSTVIQDACKFVSSDTASSPLCCFEGKYSAWVFATDLKHKSPYSHQYAAPGRCVDFLDCSLMYNKETEIQPSVTFAWDANQTREVLLPLGHPCLGMTPVRHTVYVFTSVTTAVLLALVVFLHLRKLRYVTAAVKSGVKVAGRVGTAVAASTRRLTIAFSRPSSVTLPSRPLSATMQNRPPLLAQQPVRSPNSLCCRDVTRLKSSSVQALVVITSVIYLATISLLVIWAMIVAYNEDASKLLLLPSFAIISLSVEGLQYLPRLNATKSIFAGTFLGDGSFVRGFGWKDICAIAGRSIVAFFVTLGLAFLCIVAPVTMIAQVMHEWFECSVW